MADIIVGKSTKNKLVATEDKTQLYGLAVNDTLISDGSLSGGAGSDTFELNYSTDKKISDVIEDLPRLKIKSS